jgi:hypothetical protein
MVRAILDGRKTQTRRGIDLDQFGPSTTVGYDWTWRGQAPVRSIAQQRRHAGGCWQEVRHDRLMSLCPYGSHGDRLWVRESFWNGVNCYTDASGEAVSYWTDKVQYLEERSEPGPWSEPYGSNVPWMVKRPSIHMPRKLSRITLEITGVRVERLNEIREADAISEGCQCAGVPASLTNVGAFAKLWESINGPGSWVANPWVWVVEFKPVEVKRG